MTANSPREVPPRLTAHVAEDGVGAVIGRVRQVLCALHGHDNLLQFEQARMYLRCVTCGHESPGWTIDTTAGDTLRREPRPLRHGQPPLRAAEIVETRRIA